MNGIAALSADQRNELFAMSAEKRGMGSVAVVEKDFWVCWTLKRIFGRNPSFEEIVAGLTDLEAEINAWSLRHEIHRSLTGISHHGPSP
ncbi:MAG: hypothetical protein EOM12_16060 [Verrucomicrobiae bacterium]|nr:hypothetical protein [Verrucomicrobiae bacterium]